MFDLALEIGANLCTSRIHRLNNSCEKKYMILQQVAD